MYILLKANFSNLMVKDCKVLPESTDASKLYLCVPSSSSKTFGERTKGVFWRDTLKVAKNFLGPEMPFSAFWCGNYDVTGQEHSWLLSFLRVKKQDTFPAGSENEANNQLPFLTNQRRALTNTRAASPSAHQ